MNAPEDRGTVRIPSLDGLRALSIAMVLLGHLSGTRGSPVPQFFERYANFGVRAFFVISGFLITTILLAEHRKTGVISVRDFFIRRVFRIFPAAYVYTTVIVVLAAHSLRRVDIASAYGYLANYNLSRPWIIGHLWSLSVEEQFYLIWPLLVCVAFRYRRNLAIGGILMGPPMRIAFKLMGFSGSAIGFYFPCVADSLATGCLLAILWPRMNVWMPRLHGRWVALLALGALSVPFWADLSARIGVPASQIVGITLMNVGIALCVDRVVRRPPAILQHPVLTRIGVLSYSLYLWQQPFLNRSSAAWYTAFPVNLMLALSLAAVSYFGVERPFLRLRERYFSQGASRPDDRRAQADAPASLHAPRRAAAG